MVSTEDIQDHTCICWHVDLTTHSQPARQVHTHIHTQKQEVLLSGLHYSPSVVQSRGELEGGVYLKGNTPSIAHVQQQGWSVCEG